MRTVGSKSPAIVEGPNQLDLLLLEVTEQHSKMAIMTVDVMQMNQVGLDALQLSDDPLGSLYGIEAIVAEHSGFYGLKEDIASVRATNSSVIAVRPVAVQNIVFNSFFCQELTDLHTDFSCAADAAGRVNLSNSHNDSYSQKNL
jgi:hypothetical protein